MEGSARRRSRAACSEAQSLAGFRSARPPAPREAICGRCARRGHSEPQAFHQTRKLGPQLLATQFARETRGLLAGGIGAQTNEAILIALAELLGRERRATSVLAVTIGAASVFAASIFVGREACRSPLEQVAHKSRPDERRGRRASHRASRIVQPSDSPKPRRRRIRRGAAAGLAAGGDAATLGAAGAPARARHFRRPASRRRKAPDDGWSRAARRRAPCRARAGYRGPAG